MTRPSLDVSLGTGNHFGRSCRLTFDYAPALEPDEDASACNVETCQSLRELAPDLLVSVQRSTRTALRSRSDALSKDGRRQFGNWLRERGFQQPENCDCELSLGETVRLPLIAAGELAVATIAHLKSAQIEDEGWRIEIGTLAGRKLYQ